MPFSSSLPPAPKKKKNKKKTTSHTQSTKIPFTRFRHQSIHSFTRPLTAALLHTQRELPHQFNASLLWIAILTVKRRALANAGIVRVSGQVIFPVLPVTLHCHRNRLGGVAVSRWRRHHRFCLFLDVDLDLDGELLWLLFVFISLRLFL